MEIDIRFISPDHWWQRTKWMLLSDYTSPEGVLVPKGYISDGATVPWLLRLFVSPTGKIFPAALVHDWLLDIGCDWDMANKAFEKELKHCNISDFRRRVIIGAVTLYSKLER